VFLNQFVDQATHLDYNSACDIYVTSYLNEAQMTSGTLAYSYGLGTAVISTPYWHAKELLGDGSGILVPFGDSEAIGCEIANLLADDVRRDSMRKRAYAASRWMTWARTAESYRAVFESTCWPGMSPSLCLERPVVAYSDAKPLPEVRIDHFLSLCDSTGLLQHSVYSVPDRTHGYCIDDNARALLFSTALVRGGETRLPETLTTRFASFIQHAWNPDNGRFRNFMSYDRRWLEESGSEDSHARTLWALADHAQTGADPSRRRWALALFSAALPAVQTFTSPRAWAFSLLGLDAYCEHHRGNAFAEQLRGQLANRLLAHLSATETRDWCWFEDVLAYDNPRLSQAMIQTGLATGTRAYVDAGLRSLRWLMSLQTTASGTFRPVGTESFGRARQPPGLFDQQPVEAWAAIAACIAASRADSGANWPAAARRAFDWFLGENDLATRMSDSDTGGCSDGLHPDRANENRGAESVLSYLISLVELRQFERTATKRLATPQSIVSRAAAHRTVAAKPLPRTNIVPIDIPQSPDLAPAPRSGSGRRSTLQASSRTSGP
jgi:hypothetical protein